MPVQVVCHRGANAYAPENTFAAAQLCADWGVDYVEIDVSASRDGVLYLLHGPDLSVTTNGAGLISSADAAYLDTLEAGSWFAPEFSDEPLPRLSTFLTWLRGKAQVFLDVKAGQPQELLAVLAETEMLDTCFVWSHSEAWLQQLRALHADIPIKLNVRNAAELRAAKEALNASIVETTLEDVTPELLSAARDLRMKVMIAEFSKSRARFRRVLELDVDLINVDHADIFLEVEKQFRNRQPFGTRHRWGQRLGSYHDLAELVTAPLQGASECLGGSRLYG